MTEMFAESASGDYEPSQRLRTIEERYHGLAQQAVEQATAEARKILQEVQAGFPKHQFALNMGMGSLGIRITPAVETRNTAYDLLMVPEIQRDIAEEKNPRTKRMLQSCLMVLNLCLYLDRTFHQDIDPVEVG